MRTLILAIMWMVATVGDTRGNPDLGILRPQGFGPLTALPWEADRTAGLGQVLSSIFHESSLNVRFAVLEVYLRQIPADQLGVAFEQCLELEATSNPDLLVSFFLRIWAERDPSRCWERTRTLFPVLGIDPGWLAFDTWSKPRMVVWDARAIAASKIWLSSNSLTTFPEGVEASNVGSEEKKRLLRQFNEMWLPDRMSLPKSWDDRDAYYGLSGSHGVSAVMAAKPDALGALMSHPVSGRDEAMFELGARRWLVAQPARAVEIVSFILGRTWENESETTRKPVRQPSVDLLVLWAERDVPGMMKWAESLGPDRLLLADIAKGMLMPFVDKSVRERWIALDGSGRGDSEVRSSLVENWAYWDFRSAWAEALKSGDWQAIGQAAEGGVFRPMEGEPFNMRAYPQEMASSLDLSALPQDVRYELVKLWAVVVMEHLGDADVGTAARWGYDILIKTGYTPRDELLKLFAGDNAFAGDGDVLDRTFCALRVWAATQPEAMRKWIGSLKDQEMRQSLTWLLEHPWGTGDVE